MKRLLSFFIFVLFLAAPGCQKSTNIANTVANAKITGFVAEKCMCCWGWVIEMNSQIIKADSLPGLDPGTNLVLPVNVRISIGNKTRSCAGYESDSISVPDYYEIKSITIIK